MSKHLKKRELQAAADDILLRWGENLHEEQESHEFSTSFRMKMEELTAIGKEKRQHPAARRIAIAVLALILSFGTLLAVSSPARAAVSAWLREIISGNFLYHFSQTDQPAALPELSFSHVPEGMKLISQESDDATRLYVFQNDTNGDILTCQYIHPSAGSAALLLDVDPSVYDIIERTIGHFSVECCIPKMPGESCNYTGTDEDGFIIIINSTLSDAENCLFIAGIR